MRLRQTGQQREILILAQLRAKPLGLFDPHSAHPWPQWLDQFHLIAMLNDALAQLVDFLGCCQGPIFRNAPPRPPVSCGEARGQIRKGHVIERPLTGRRLRRANPLDQSRPGLGVQLGMFLGSPDLFQPAGDCLDRTGRQRVLRQLLKKVIQSIERGLRVTRTTQAGGRGRELRYAGANLPRREGAAAAASASS